MTSPRGAQKELKIRVLDAFGGPHACSVEAPQRAASQARVNVAARKEPSKWYRGRPHSDMGAYDIHWHDITLRALS